MQAFRVALTLAAFIRAAGGGSTPLNDPYAIFAKARERLETARYPAQISYEVVITVRKGATTSAAR